MGSKPLVSSLTIEKNKELAMGHNDAICMRSLKSRIAHDSFIATTFDKEKSTEGAMKVVNVKSNFIFKVCAHIFCAEGILRLMRQHQISMKGTKKTCELDSCLDICGEDLSCIAHAVHCKHSESVIMSVNEIDILLNPT